MRTIFYLCMLLGLGLSSCEKENQSQSNEKSVEIAVAKIQIYGVKYNQDSVFNQMSIGTGFSTEQIYFDESTQKFKIKDFYLEFKPEDYLILKGQ
ncbi:hypothetical protein SAMN05660841_00012 [Sphingobacterium nematocida]|uniref:Uncharacterized protein n=1 Tax=Sphingobacterium nematocida TaxID=1513896 RepID=A0A1T5AMD0_9SPHI|nr:hypothetical protein [Sphingobacterium nematocida]SKB36162.1 hypothetical protein SAMN05660841_00012 [Sphingobacterium nematocida]